MIKATYVLDGATVSMLGSGVKPGCKPIRPLSRDEVFYWMTVWVSTQLAIADDYDLDAFAMNPDMLRVVITVEEEGIE